MNKLLFISLSTTIFSINTYSQQDWTEISKNSYSIIKNNNGLTLGYTPQSGVNILTVDGLAFKDLNKNGKLDIYEDWRKPVAERAKDLATKMTVEQMAGLMLYSRHQAVPAPEAGMFTGTYNGKPFSASGVKPSDLSDQQIAFLTKDNLEMHYDVTHCIDGEMCLKAFKSEAFDICVFDVMMPKMDGFTVAEEIRKDDTEVPLIFLTAKSLKEDKIKGLKLGADDYIIKPIKPRALLSRIQAFFRRETQKSEPDGILEIARENKNVVVLTADLAGSFKLGPLMKELPERFIEVGIAEANMIGIAAGLTIGGRIPYTTTFAGFSTGRVYDQIRQSVAYSDKNVKICASHAGLTLGEDGATHQILEDIGLMKMLPGMTVIVPCDYNQTKAATKMIAGYEGPVYLRFGRPKWPNFTKEDGSDFVIGKAQKLRPPEVRLFE